MNPLAFDELPKPTDLPDWALAPVDYVMSTYPAERIVAALEAGAGDLPALIEALTAEVAA